MFGDSKFMGPNKGKKKKNIKCLLTAHPRLSIHTQAG